MSGRDALAPPPLRGEEIARLHALPSPHGGAVEAMRPSLRDDVSVAQLLSLAQHIARSGAEPRERRAERTAAARRLPVSRLTWTPSSACTTGPATRRATRRSSRSCALRAAKREGRDRIREGAG